jgi:hypothetical protein
MQPFLTWLARRELSALRRRRAHRLDERLRLVRAWRCRVRRCRCIVDS